MKSRSDMNLKSRKETLATETLCDRAVQKSLNQNFNLVFSVFLCFKTQFDDLIKIHLFYKVFGKFYFK